jgi:hypothetical protein
MSTKRVLHLTLKKKWFDLIAQSKKKVEYRERKPHWESRLVKNEKQRWFDEVRFTNGYGADKPWMRVRFLGTGRYTGRKCRPNNGEILKSDQEYFLIYLGPILEIGNYEH